MANIHKYAVGFTRLMAIVGGAVLAVLILMICVSILGRALNSTLHSAISLGILPGVAQSLIDAGVGAIRGDFELVEAGMAFSIFAFIPYCHVTAGHASVDVFTDFLPKGAMRVLETLIAILFAIALVIIAMQLEEGLARKIRSGQTTLLLQFPEWWAYALCLVGAVIAAITGVYMALVRVYELLTGQNVVTRMGAEH